MLLSRFLILLSKAVFSVVVQFHVTVTKSSVAIVKNCIVVFKSSVAAVKKTLILL